jgi:hypothetical protein
MVSPESPLSPESPRIPVSPESPNPGGEQVLGDEVANGVGINGELSSVQRCSIVRDDMKRGDFFVQINAHESRQFFLARDGWAFGLVSGFF